MRKRIADLETNRASRGSRIFVTGGTGFLGSHIAARLLEAGYRVCLLARPDKGLSARSRIDRLLDWHGVNVESRQNLRLVEGSLAEPGLGLDAESRAVVLENNDEIIHCASNTLFSEKKRAAVEAANIDGLLNTLDLAVESRCVFFHYLSTAYAAGRKTGLCLEEAVDSGEFTNVYEETKARGEKLTADRCRQAGIRLNIYRPTIVCGDSKTGRSLRFNAVYHPVKMAVFLRDLYLADIREQEGKKAGLLGIRLASDGRLFMPIRIRTGPEGGINLIPVDYFTDAFLALWEECPGGGIFHIANPGQKRIGDIIEYAKIFFRLEGIESYCPQAGREEPRNALEVLFDKYVEAYGPYMHDTRIFDLANSSPILKNKSVRCPEFDYDVFSRCMAYAVQADWGARLFR